MRRIVAFILMIAIANTVIDPPDLLKNIDQDVALEEDLSVNEIESVVELVVEGALDIENAIPEKEERDLDDIFKKLNVFYVGEVIEFTPEFICEEPKPPLNAFFLSRFPTFELKIEAPPPRI